MLRETNVDAAYLDEYQRWSADLLIGSIGEAGTVGDSGLTPLAYCIEGIIEETAEVVETTLEYDRMSTVLGGETPDEHDAFELLTHRERHKKEFGDVSWYGAATLSILGVNLSDQFERSVLSKDAKDNSSLPSLLVNNEAHNGFVLINVLDGLRSSARRLYRTEPLTIIHIDGSMHSVSNPEEVLRRKILLGRDDRIGLTQELIRSIGDYFVTANDTLPKLFDEDTTLETILLANQSKIEKRIKDKTIYKVSGVGGDDR